MTKNKKFSDPEAAARNRILSVSRKFLSNLGGNRYHPYLFKYLQEVAAEYNCDLNGAPPGDLCFVARPPKPSQFVSVKTMREFYNLHHPVDVGEQDDGQATKTGTE